METYADFFDRDGFTNMWGRSGIYRNAATGILLNIPIMYFLIPGYAVALVLTFVVPEMFTAIAFDSGGVASGPLTSSFVLPLAIGICNCVC